MNSIRKLQIGNVTLENNLILAPMAGVTDLPFRLLCKEQGAGLLCMEMVSAKAILYNNKNTKELLTVHPKEGPVSVQLFGSDPEIMAAQLCLPVSVWLNLCDREPEREAEVTRLIERHIRQFFDVYRAK